MRAIAKYAVRAAVILSLSGLWFLVDTHEAYACSCARPGSPSEELARVPMVFAGEVVSTWTFYDYFGQEINPPGVVDYFRETSELDFRDYVSTRAGSLLFLAQQNATLLAEFKVDTVWKGPLYETVFVQTSAYGESCGIGFAEGAEYLFYSSHSCSRTRPLDYAQQDLEELGEGRVPEPGTSAPRPDSI